MHGIADLITGPTGTPVAITPCYCRGDGCNNYTEWGGEEMSTGPAVRPVVPTTLPPITTTTTAYVDGGGDVDVDLDGDGGMINPGGTSGEEEPPRYLQCWDVPWTGFG